MVRSDMLVAAYRYKVIISVAATSIFPLIASAQAPGTPLPYVCRCNGIPSCYPEGAQCRNCEFGPHKADKKGQRCYGRVVSAPTPPVTVIANPRTYPVCESWTGKARFTDKNPNVNYFRVGRTLTDESSSEHHINWVCATFPSDKTVKGVFCGARETGPQFNAADDGTDKAFHACVFSGNPKTHSDCLIGDMGLYAWKDNTYPQHNIREICFHAKNWAEKVRLSLIEVYTD